MLARCHTQSDVTVVAGLHDLSCFSWEGLASFCEEQSKTKLRVKEFLPVCLHSAGQGPLLRFSECFQLQEVGFKFVVLSTWLGKYAKLFHFVSIHLLLSSRTGFEVLGL